MEERRDLHLSDALVKPAEQLRDRRRELGEAALMTGGEGIAHLDRGRDAARYTFPVTGGRVDAKTLAGNVRHSGGLLLAQRDGMGWKALGLTKFTINITGSPNLTAVVNGGDRLAIADLDLGDAQIKKYSKKGRAYVSIKNVGVTLNSTAMGAINATFGTALPDEVPLGTANVLARVAQAH